MYLTPTKEHWACDIEADNLLDKATKIHCVCVINVETKEEKEFTDASVFQAWLIASPLAILVGHNFIAYDLVMLNRFWGARLPVSRIVDTFVLSQLYNPNYKGGHSLEAWGKRLRYPKGHHDDYERFTPAMLLYCRRDARLTALLYLKLTERMRQTGFSELGCEIEHLAWNIIQNKQYRNGFPFDKKKAEELYVTLRAREEELQDEIYRLWPPQYLRVKTFQKAYKKNGEATKDYERHLGQYPELRIDDDGRYHAYDYVAFNLGSPPQRVDKLLELGWEPVKFTKVTDKGGGGNPKIDEDSLLAFAETSGNTEILALAKWIVINSRANMVRTWLNAYDEKTNSIHGKLFIAGTLRYRHSGPNSANIPAVRLKKDKDGKDEIRYGEDGSYTYEARDCWICGDPSEWSLVGIDGKGIQLRVLANYAYSESFVESVLAGDPHTNNIKVLGLSNKAAAKKFLYTTLMGGGGELLAADQAQFGTKLTEMQGNSLKRRLIGSIPGFRELINALQKELRDTGRIRLCDDTPILVPSPHMVIPYLLQGDESRLMKKAMILLEKGLKRHGIEAKKVADIHDEWQYRVRTPEVGAFVKEALAVFPKAGESFGYRVPIEGSAKVGKTWAETH